MSFLRTLNTSGSALTAQRMRLDVIAENISNIDTTRTENGGPYTRKIVRFQSVSDGNFRNALNRAYDRGDRLHRVFKCPFHGHSAGTGAKDGGVIVSDIFEDETPHKIIYDPSHPDADEYGYVRMPNVDMLKEVVDAMSASRSYEANVTAINAIKVMASKALEVGK